LGVELQINLNLTGKTSLEFDLAQVSLQWRATAFKC